MGKKIKKIVKKVTNVASGGLLGDEKDGKAAEAPAAAVAAPTAAAVVEAPKEETDTEVDDDTEAGKKAARAKGKRNLQVARSAGSGINI